MSTIPANAFRRLDLKHKFGAFCTNVDAMSDDEVDRVHHHITKTIAEINARAPQPAPTHAANSSGPEFIVNGGRSADPYAGYSVNEAVYEIEFAEHARRTGKPREAIREQVLSRLADDGHNLGLLLGNSDAVNLELYGQLLANEAADEGELLRAASKLRTTVQGTSNDALVSLGLPKLAELQALMERAQASSLATTSQPGA